MSEEIRKLLKDNRNKSVLVLGAGVTGRAAADFLVRSSFHVLVLDEKQVNQEVSSEFKQKGIELISQYQVSPQSIAELKQQGFVFAIASPGFPVKGPLWQTLTSAGIRIIPELDLALTFLGMPDVAVTGTNGKTTTVHLVHQMLVNSGMTTELAGNVGTPLISFVKPEWLTLPEHQSPWQVEKEKRPFFVVEVSSYQLETATNFNPRVGVLLNLDYDHLDRHGTMEQYLTIKSKVYSTQTVETGWAIVGVDDPRSPQMKKYCKSRFFPVSIRAKTISGDGCYYEPDQHKMIFTQGPVREEYSLKNFKLLGDHNKQNLAAALSAARLIGATPQGIQQVIDNFLPVDHRLEIVAKKKGVFYVNDSKATNISSTRVAISAMAKDFAGGKNIILLLGGQAKTGDWKVLADPINCSVKQLIGFGVDGPMIIEELKDCSAKSLVCQNLSAAMEKASSIAVEGDVVLLAPACASFDQYSDYTARGRHFRELVEELNVF